ncbi:MAG: shikimate kinase [Agarilytica sp.]
MKRPAIFLIGMPGAGKSTLGVLLAKALAMPFIDTDLLIQGRAECTLQAYLDTFGFMALRELEESVLLEDDFAHKIVSTGGSVVYSDKGMGRLGQIGIRLYLKVGLETMLARINNADSRGLACKPGTSLENIYSERAPLYEKYADIVVEVDELNFDQSLQKIISTLALDKRWS